MGHCHIFSCSFIMEIQEWCWIIGKKLMLYNKVIVDSVSESISKAIERQIWSSE